MRSLNLWIEAQLKRGYSANRIKSVLVKRGYPPKAVAEVDRTIEVILRNEEGSRDKAATSAPKHGYNTLPIVIIIGAIVLIGILYSVNRSHNLPILLEENSTIAKETLIGEFLQKNLQDKFIQPTNPIINTYEGKQKISYRWSQEDKQFYVDYIETPQDRLIINVIFPSNVAEISAEDAYGLYGEIFKSNGEWNCKPSQAKSHMLCSADISGGKASITLKYENTDSIRVMYGVKI